MALLDAVPCHTDKWFFWTGFLGDLFLQFMTSRGFFTRSQLSEYFDRHGSIESALIAGGMMYFVYDIYSMLQIPINMVNMFSYGVILDFIFRFGEISQTLSNSYYQELGVFETALYGGISTIIPLLICKYRNERPVSNKILEAILNLSTRVGARRL